MREKIEQFVLAWERKATADMFLSERLHPRIRIKLIDGLTSIFEQAMEAQPALTVAKVQEAAKADARKVTGIDNLPAAPVDPEAEQMAALKAKLASKPAKKGKAA